MEVFDPASTLVFSLVMAAGVLYTASARTAQKTTIATVTPLLRVTQPLPNNGCFLVPHFLL
jgi:hypothetical protein